MPTQRITGTVQSGAGSNALPLTGLHVTVYEATTGDPRILAVVNPDPAGRFSADVEDPTDGSILYATAHLDARLQMATIIGAEVRGAIVINELTTVAAAFSMAQFTESSVVSGDAFALRIAAGMSDNLVSPLTGEPSAVMLASPNADETNSLRSTRALANLIAPCVRKEPGALERVLELTTPPGGPAIGDTFQALVNVARHPANNVAEIYTQAQALEIYTPTLENLPQAWTLAVKVNDSGCDNFLFGGPANIAFDENGFAWVANNVIQGTPNSAQWIMVLQPDGRPADGRNGTPCSPVFGGGLFGVGFGVTVAPNGHVWVGNFGWGDPDTQYPVNGTVTELDALGRPVSPPAGYGGGTDRVQQAVADREGNIWMASFGNDRLVVFRGGDPGNAVAYPPTADGTPPGTGPFGIAIAGPGEAWVTYAGGLGWPEAHTGTLCKYSLTSTTLECTFQMPLGEVTKGVALDSAGNVWVAAGGREHDPATAGDPNLAGSTVYMVSADGTKATGFRGGGIDGPWSVAVDGDDHVWVANFGRMGFTSDYTTAGITRLAGINPPEGFSTGDPISPPSGYTLPSAGSPVLLRNGDPLYGPGAEPCYSPLMRMTNVVIDRAGNVWAVNNWKPDFATDAPTGTGNPGGDGICIFVGLARPPRPKH